MRENLNKDNLDQGDYTLTGTILKRKDSIKSTQSLLIFLKDIGPRWISAPSSTGKNKSSSITEPLIWGNFNIYQSPSKLFLKSIDIKQDFLTIRSDIKKLKTAIELYKITINNVYLNHESNDMLKILWNAMLQINESAKPEYIKFRFIWKLLKIIGRAPSLLCCSKCGSPITSSTLSWDEDGLICSRCTNTTKLTLEEMRNMQFAVYLSHEKFIQWSNITNFSENISDISKHMLTFF
ncbi:MAG: DNA repair protein RecO [Synergistaceae bacterium]